MRGPGPPEAPVGAGFLVPAVLAFLSLALVVLLRHEMWQDEWQAWLLATGSPTLPDLFRNLRYEGHPCLWYLALFGVGRLTHSPLGIQLLHLVVATSSVYLICQYSPFSRLQKILFIFGYFPFYEYAAISRNYALGVLGLFSFCAVFGMPRPRNYLLLAAILLLLCQTSVYGVMLALPLGVVLFGAALRDPAAGTWKTAAAGTIVLLGVGLAVVQLVPPADSGFAVDWNFHLDFRHLTETLATVWRGYVPIPARDYHFWGTNFVPDPRWQAVLAVILLAFGLLLFLPQALPFFLYAVGTLGLLAFAYTKYPGSIRHHGHLFLLFMASLWLSSYFPERKIRPAWLGVFSGFCRTHRHRVVVALMAAQLLAGWWAASMDLAFPFSASKEAAGFIQQHRLEEMLILGDADDAASSVAGYLGRRLYYPASRRWGSFVIWDQQRARVTPGELTRQARELSRGRQQDALLLLNYELPPGSLPMILLKRFGGSLVPAENYCLYLLPSRAGDPQ